nr:MAG TPA: dsDNA helicase [Caudoviricetes sp.]
MFTLYSADYINAPSNCSYPHKFEVTDTDSFADAVRHDYVCAEYMNHYRNGDNFLGSDCLPVDCDNDHSENPDDWVTPADVRAAFPGITFAVHYSRFNMREKNSKPARPKFHVLFPIEYMTDAAAYSEMKKLVNTIFPYFDTKALDAARFFFGTANPEVELYSGEMTLSEYLSAEDFDADMSGGSYGSTQVISEGSRNATMSRFAGRVIKKYGNSEEAFNCFMEEADKCTPPLEHQELMTIWRSAQKFYSKIQQQDGYVPPELYNDENSYKPDDFSDVGQAEILAKHFSGELRYSPATHYIRYNGRYWQETEPGAQAVAHELTRRQMKEASADMLAALAALKACGAQDILENNSKAL